MPTYREIDDPPEPDERETAAFSAHVWPLIKELGRVLLVAAVIFVGVAMLGYVLSSPRIDETDEQPLRFNDSAAMRGLPQMAK